MEFCLYVSVSFRSCMFSYPLVKIGIVEIGNGFRLLSELYVFLFISVGETKEGKAFQGFRLLSELYVFLLGLISPGVRLLLGSVSVSFRSCMFSYSMHLKLFYYNVFRPHFREILIKNNFFVFFH